MQKVLLTKKEIRLGKLDSRCEQGIFIGYDKNSPAYLVFYPNTKKVQKHRLVKFTTRTTKERETQTSERHTEYEDMNPNIINSEENVDESVKDVTGQDNQSGASETLPEQTESTQPDGATETVIRRNPPRNRRRLAHLQDFETGNMEDKLQTCIEFCSMRYTANLPGCHNVNQVKAMEKCRGQRNAFIGRKQDFHTHFMDLKSLRQGLLQKATVRNWGLTMMKYSYPQQT